MEKKWKTEHDNLLPDKGNPLHETVIYKIGDTLYKVSTICGGLELLYHKMEQLIKDEISRTPADKMGVPLFRCLLF